MNKIKGWEQQNFKYVLFDFNSTSTQLGLFHAGG